MLFRHVLFIFLLPLTLLSFGNAYNSRFFACLLVPPRLTVLFLAVPEDEVSCAPEAIA